jgi:Plasmid pRiA4b ORF-3-like protein
LKVYCIKVALFYKKRIYRNIEILENQSVANLHASIFEAFDRYDEHLYSFFLTGKAIKSTSYIYDYPEITHPMNLGDLAGFTHKKRYNAKMMKIRDLNLDEKGNGRSLHYNTTNRKETKSCQQTPSGFTA